MNSNRGKTLYVFAPHPDDESFACGGMIVKRLAEGFTVKVVVMTDGSHSHSTVLSIFSDPTPEELAKRRKKELQEATAILGVASENVMWLEAEDGALSTVQELMAEKVTKILAVEHDIVEVYVPHAKEHHRDHKATNAIVQQVIEELDLSPQVYYYIIWGTEEEHDLGTKIEIDISDVLLAKVEAIHKYTSQISLISQQQDRPVLLPSFVERYCTATIETFWK